MDGQQSNSEQRTSRDSSATLPIPPTTMTEDENSLTAALVAALVQTRDGPPPPPPPPPATTTTFTQQGTLTRSGRRTRPTPFALPTPTPASPAPTPEQQQSQQPPSQRVRWSAQEDSELIKLIREEPPLTWLQMGQRLNRPGQGCAMRWYNFIRKTVEKNEADQLSNKIRGNNNGQTTTTTKKRSKSVSPEEEVQQYEEIPLPPPPPQPIQPSIEMQVGSSRSAAYNDHNDEEEALVLPTPPPLLQQQQQQQLNSYPGGYPLTGKVLPLNTIPSSLLPPRLPPSTSLPGHPFPRPLTVHSNSGPNFLPDQALVSNPPIPFPKNTVIRGRRTHSTDSLAKHLKDNEVPLVSSKQKPKKVHSCPALNCGAAFKRSEHLKRHYKSVHRGEKPFPCKIENCGKSFSRKDNLQQHQAMVHGVRAIYTYSDGTVSVNPPDGDEDPVSIHYEAVDITKTARGAQRAARQEERVKRKLTKTSQKNGKPKSTAPRKKKNKSEEVEDEEEEGSQQGDEDDEEDEDDEDKIDEEEEDSYLANQLLNNRRTRQLTSFNNKTSTVQDLMMLNSSVANQSFSIRPTRTTHLQESSDSRSSSESNERGGEKRNRDINESEGTNGVDKRLRLTRGDSNSQEELDPVLRALADTTTTTSAEGSSSTRDLSPLIQHALEQRIVQTQTRDIPVLSTRPFVTGRRDGSVDR